MRKIEIQKLAPIVLFTYNRPWHLRQTVEALQKNELASESELFIFSDGLRDEESGRKVKEVREYLRTIDGFKKVIIIERDKNWGLANNIIDGVTRVVNEHGKVIVLEDDIITSPYFLRFMNESLSFYENEERVMHISGYNFPIITDGLPDVFFIKPTSCWGWATWARAWKYYRKDVNYYLKVFDKKMIFDFNLDNSYDYFKQILLNSKGKINTWAIFWYASVYLNNGLSLHSKESFVRNIGHDGSGIHCVETNKFESKLADKYNISFTKEIIHSDLARQRYIEYFKSLKDPLFKRLMRKIKSMGNRLTVVKK